MEEKNASVERVTTRTRAAIIEGPASVGPVADPGAVATAIIRWLSSVYENDPAKRALIDAHVLMSDAHVLTAPESDASSLQQEAA